MHAGEFLYDFTKAFDCSKSWQFVEYIIFMAFKEWLQNGSDPI
jgi:hypothetical protein